MQDNESALELGPAAWASLGTMAVAALSSDRCLGLALQGMGRREEPLTPGKALRVCCWFD